MQIKTIQTKLPVSWDAQEGKAVSEMQPLEVPEATSVGDLVKHFDNDETAFLRFVNSALVDREKRRAYQADRKSVV